MNWKKSLAKFLDELTGLVSDVRQVLKEQEGRR